jgi:hypothetical protein
MGIPQLNPEQVNTLTEMSTNGLGAFSQAVPDAKFDSAADYEKEMEMVRDTEQLVILGLIKEITDESTTKDKLVTMFAMSGRLFRVFQITDIGKRMFDGVKRTIQ